MNGGGNRKGTRGRGRLPMESLTPYGSDYSRRLGDVGADDDAAVLRHEIVIDVFDPGRDL